MFESARLKLTAWYLAIIMAISLLFSLIIYSGVNAEYTHIERFQKKMRQRLEQGMPVQLRNPEDLELLQVDPEMIKHARLRLISTLAFINAAIFGLSGVAGYFLAGRTLKPIKIMVDEQNRFIADASHELRTPITALRTETEVALLHKKISTSDAKKLLESNLEEVINLQILSDNLLELAQTGNVNKTIHFAPVSVDTCLADAIKKVEKLAKKKSISIEKQIAASTILGLCDRITELFVILLDNAVKYSPENSIITITTKKKKSLIEVTVTDQGSGIEAEDVPFIFDRFYRASKSRSKSGVPGYGLGLSIAKKIVDQHGGEIQVKSKIAEGSVFIIQLPTIR